ncbi:MAG: rhodanese-like domain-containing protein [Planctomycetaceae bacterium]|nr:rhodanese-like domain-containing protein [Planctomycetaceae bacterium]
MNSRFIRYGVALGCWAIASASSLAADHTTDTLPAVKKNVEDKKAVLVDVREQSEWNDGHVTGAVLLPLSELHAGIDKDALAKRLPKDQIVYTHCAVGKRSLTAADILIKAGYDVRALKAGYKDLIEAGFKKADE